jgi:fatty-acyl-CoA synthase
MNAVRRTQKSDPFETDRSPGDLTTGLMLKKAAGHWPASTALIFDGNRLTYDELYAESVRYARGLLALGVKPEDHVGILMPNCTDYILLFYAAGLIGARVLTINARYKEDDLRYVLENADVQYLFIGGHALPYYDFRTMLAEMHPEIAAWDGTSPLRVAGAPKLKAIVNFDDDRESAWPGRREFMAGGDTVGPAAVDAAAEAADPDSVALMMFSSGTTARPKACMLTHRSLNLTGAALAERFRLTPDDRIYNPLPLFHMSTMLPLAACRASGAALIGTMHFEAGEGLATIERERATVSYTSFPTLVSALINHPDFGTRDLSSLRIMHCVGPADLLRRYAQAFPQAFFVNAYGLTEASGVPVYSDLADPQGYSFTTAGRPFTGVDAKSVDPETGADLPTGERGEIWLRGFCVFAGYYKDEEATRRVKQPDGWLRTGDMGYIDEGGRVVYDGRLKDMLKIGGENVAALEIETYLCTHPDVAIAQVIGVPDEHLFEVAAAYVELNPGATVMPEELIDHCIGKIASYKIPRYVRIVTEWPMSTTKIQKFKLDRTFDAGEKIDVKSRISALEEQAR